jgi:hypothetical protein
MPVMLVVVEEAEVEVEEEEAVVLLEAEEEVVLPLEERVLLRASTATSIYRIAVISIAPM